MMFVNFINVILNFVIFLKIFFLSTKFIDVCLQRDFFFTSQVAKDLNFVITFFPVHVLIITFTF